MAHHSKARLAEIIASAADAIVSTDEEQRIIVFNSAAEKLFGYRAVEVIGKPLDLLIPERVRAQHREHIRRFSATGETHRRMGQLGEIVGLRADGEEILIEAAISQTGSSPHKIFTAFLRDVTERWRAELAMLPRELRIEGVIASMAEGIVSIDKTLRIVLANPAAEHMFGRSLKEMLGQPLSALIPERFRAQHDQHIRRFAATGQTNRAMGKYGPIYGLRASGEEFPIEATISQSGASGDRLLTVILRDITERRHAEEGLLRFRMAMETSLEGIFLMDFETFRYLDVNETGCRMLGYSREELLTMRTMDTNLEISEADQRQRFEQARALGSDHVITEAEGRFMRRKDGSTFPIEVARRYMRIGEQEIVVGIARDITERRQADEELRRSRALLSSIVENIPAMIFLKNAGDLRFALTNRAFEELTGLSKGKLLGKHDHDFFPKEEADFFVANDKAVLASGELLDLPEESIQTPSGTRFLHTKKIPLLDDGGKLQYLLGISEDITERALSARRSVEQFRILELIAQAVPLAGILDALCRSFESLCARGASASILLLDADGIHLRHGAAPNLPERYIRAIDGVAIGPAVGSCGTAAYLARQVIVSDIENDPLWRDYRDVALRDGLRACWSTPIFSDKRKVLATFAIYYREVKTPNDAELELIDRAAHLASIAIGRAQNDLALRESEAKYRELIEQASDGIFVSDTAGNALIVNSRWRELLGYTKEEVAGINTTQTYLDEEKPIHAKRLDQVRAGQTLRFERMVRRKDGSAFPAEISLKMLGNESVLGIYRDISERRAQEQKIVRLIRIHEVLSGINSAIVRIRDRQELFEEACRIVVEQGRFTTGWISVLDPASGNLLAVAQAGLPLDFGLEGGSSIRSIGLVPAGTAKVALREKRPAFDNDIERTLGSIESESAPGTMNIRRAAIDMGAKSVIALPLIVEDEVLGILALYAPERNFFDDEEMKLLTELAGDISFGLEFIAKEEKADYLAYYDVLSGLPNRTLFFDRFTHQLGTAARDGSSVALVLMDIDRFRLINDTLGRHAGDALIGMVAQRIKETFRDQDSMARVGANSFAVAVSGAWQAGDAARILAAHNRQLFGQPFLLGTEQLRVSATVGVAMFPGDGSTPEVLFANAEAALRQAKEQTALFLFYNPQMNARVAESLHLENRLRRALDNGEMVLWYQPKVSVRTRKILGFEALMRWRDPESALMVPPAQFIPLMEQTGLILQAGRWALFQVARDCSACSEAGIKPPRVAVNVSPIQLRQKDFTATVIEAAQKFKEGGAQFDLEITESTIMADVDAIIPILQTIRGLGVGIAVDDFGTGYSSLAYIARLPIQDLKIDRSFIVGMTQDEDSLAIVKSIIFLAHSLRLNVVAEGVETEEQAAILLELGCDEMQGYLISRPLPPEQAMKLLRN